MEKFTVIEACLTHRVSPTNLKDLLRLRLRLIGVSSCRVTTQKKTLPLFSKKRGFSIHKRKPSIRWRRHLEVKDVIMQTPHRNQGSKWNGKQAKTNLHLKCKFPASERNLRKKAISKLKWRRRLSRRHPLDYETNSEVSLADHKFPAHQQFVCAILIKNAGKTHFSKNNRTMVMDISH